MLFIIHVLRIANEWNKENLKDEELYLHWNKLSTPIFSVLSTFSCKKK